jgi:hypothetical protein
MRAEMTNTTTEATKTTLLSTLLSTARSINPRDFVARYWAALVVVGVLVAGLVAYAFWPRTTSATVATLTTAPAATTPSWTRVCVAGVSYLQFTSGVSVEWMPTGRVKTCTEPR